MRKWLAIALLGPLLALPSGAASGRTAMFPPAVIDSVWWRALVDDEPPLWRPESLRRFKSRIRLSISGIAAVGVLIRIDERADGGAVGRVVLINRARGGRDLMTDMDETFRVSATKMKVLRERIVQAKLWSVGSEEHWVFTDEDAICVDGEKLVFERVDADGYRFSEANAQCTAPPALLEVARTMMLLSGAKRALPLLG